MGRSDGRPVSSRGRLQRGASRAPFALLLFALDLAFQTFVSPVTLSVSNAQVTEGNAGTTHLAFPVTLSFPVGATVTATFSLANGTATGGPVLRHQRRFRQRERHGHDPGRQHDRDGYGHRLS